MKKIVVYYSLEGNTEYVAKKIAENTGCDLLKLDTLKPYPKTGFMKYFHGGKDATHNVMPELKPYEFDAAKYEMIIFATPVWARTFVPPLKTFIDQNKAALKGKRFSLFTGYRGGGSDKTAAKMAEALGIEKFENHLFLIDALAKKSDEKDEKINEFCAALMKE